MQIKRGYLHYEGRLLGEEIRKIKKVIPKTFSVKEKEADKLRMWTWVAIPPRYIWQYLEITLALTAEAGNGGRLGYTRTQRPLSTSGGIETISVAELLPILSTELAPCVSLQEANFRISPGRTFQY